SAVITFDHLAENALEERHKLILDYYQSRVEAKQIKHFGENTYNPIEPDSLYLTPKAIQSSLQSYKHCYFSSFNEPAGTVVEDGIKTISTTIDTVPTPNFYAESKKEQKTPVTLAIDFLYNRILETTKAQARKRIIIGCFTEGTLERIKRMFSEHDVSAQKIDKLEDCKNLAKKTFGLAILPIEKGFETDDYIIISEQDILGEKILRKSQNRKKKTENFLSEASSLTPNELVVHREHGIGRFIGLETIDVQNQKHDFILLYYADDDKFYVPVENVDTISRYGADDGAKLDKLGNTAWQMRKAKQKKRIQIAAETLLKIAAERELKRADIIEPSAGLYEEFCGRFPYAETEDQLRTIEEIQDDLASGKPMDRLVCGDVGFGKTEIALRSAFMTVSSSRYRKNKPPQVAVIVPTTLLARQHYQTFVERFKDMPVRIAPLSRLVTNKDAQQIREDLVQGNVDIIIGTHALLAKNIKFNNLAMVIIDEEQHFGVAQKERLKSLCSDVHVLTLTATPIPRTLQMSLSGIKSLSILGTPPIDRLAIRTYVMPFDGMVIREAIMREHYRGGRIFVVCPRIKDLPEMEEKLKTLVPEIKMVVAHGQMSPTKLDDIMNAFYDGTFDLLLATTIVESGLDVPSANTIIIHRADQFGLAQLYQLRGRVGRSNIRAYAYLTLPTKARPTANAMKRLEVMQSLDSLGAGFSIASHDMDIRGFGNLVGDEQSGHVREVGIELYQEMLKEAVENAKKSQLKEELSEQDYPDEDWSPIINLGLSVMIPERYVADLQLRMGLYKRIAHLQTDSDVEAFAAEMIDRFGTLPDEAQHLLDVVKVKQLCKKAFIEKVDTGPKGAVFTLRNNYFPNPDKLLEYINNHSHNVKLRNDYKIVLSAQWKSSEKKLKAVRAFISEIVSLTQ
ncbi:MAG: transcription-repair coupling factor, partial [Rickettsiales bacterium]|nr:transcription-repair coupling factor [Rickettsiales bacterium]